MKKLLFILCVGLITGCCFTACSSSDETNGLSETQINDLLEVLKIDVSGGTVVSGSDTHGGFHGDGYRFVEIGFDDAAGAAVAGDLAVNTGWRSLPLSENLQTVVYGKQNGDSYSGPFIITDDDTAIPAVEHGYYFFYDRQSERSNPKDDAELLNRHSFNFTFAIYDTDNHTLYYYELDT